MAGFDPERHPGVQLHETVYVDEPCEIGAGTVIWHFSHVLAGSRIGEACSIGQNVVIGPRAEIGNRVKVQNNVSVYEGVVLEDYVFCGPSLVFTNVSTPRSEVPRRDAYAPTRVGRGASLGANATIVCGTRIGEYALVGAGSVVTRDVPAYALVTGVPGRPVGWACRCGLRLATDAAEVGCPCGNRYRLAAGKLTPLREVQGEGA